MARLSSLEHAGEGREAHIYPEMVCSHLYSKVHLEPEVPLSTVLKVRHDGSAWAKIRLCRAPYPDPPAPPSSYWAQRAGYGRLPVIHHKCISKGFS